MALVFHPDIHVFQNSDELCNDAALKVLDMLKGAQGKSCIALAGGSTPKKMYQLWAEKHLSELEGTQFFFGDVRMVPDDHKDSNYLMAYESLLKHIPKERVSPVNTSIPALIAAAKYLEEMNKHVPLVEGVPRFDVVLLGVGPDGHTASLFPGTAASMEQQLLVVPCMPCEGVTPYVERVTVTAPVIQAAKNVVVLITGAEKKWVVDGILAEGPEPTSPKGFPVARLLRGCKGTVTLMCDAACAPA